MKISFSYKLIKKFNAILITAVAGISMEFNHLIRKVIWEIKDRSYSGQGFREMVTCRNCC